VHDDAQYFEHPYFQHRRNAQAGNNRRCRQIFNRLCAAIDPSSLRGERLLDVGCDTGALLLSAARQFGIVPVGGDVSSQAIHQIKAQGIEAYVTALEHAPLANLAHSPSSLPLTYSSMSSTPVPFCSSFSLDFVPGE